MYNSSNRALGFFIAIGLTFLGLSIYFSAKYIKLSERVVTVKGLAEKEVKADLAIWPIAFSYNSNYLPDVQTTIKNNANSVTKFLLEIGFNKDEILQSSPQFKDRYNQDYVNSSNIKFRYHSDQVITVRSSNIDLIIKAKTLTEKLTKDGVLISYDEYQYPTRYIYTKLNDIKPDMIKESTISARSSAEQFAKDSQSSLGKIKTATQGFFSINDLDKTTPHLKQIRVVTNVTYYLED